MVEAGGGAIVNMASAAGMKAVRGTGPYVASKHGLIGLTKNIAVEYAQHGIRANAIAPGFFLTEQNRFLMTEQGTGQLTARGQSILDHTPMNRFGEPEDLLGTVLWLLSPASSFVTGIVVPVDGGFSPFGGV